MWCSKDGEDAKKIGEKQHDISLHIGKQDQPPTELQLSKDVALSFRFNLGLADAKLHQALFFAANAQGSHTGSAAVEDGAAGEAAGDEDKKGDDADSVEDAADEAVAEDEEAGEGEQAPEKEQEEKGDDQPAKPEAAENGQE